MGYCLLCYWPAPPSIHRGLEWPQSLNRLLVCLIVLCSLSGSKFSNFSSPHLLFYSTVQTIMIGFHIRKLKQGSLGPQPCRGYPHHQYPHHLGKEFLDLVFYLVLVLFLALSSDTSKPNSAVAAVI